MKTYLYPKLGIDYEKSLNILEKSGFIKKYIDLKTRKKYGIFIDPDNLARLVRYRNERNKETFGYVEWRIAVLERDLYTCKKCGKTDTQLNVHHIKPYKKYPELRIDIDNGITLCISCHKLEHRNKKNGGRGYEK